MKSAYFWLQLCGWSLLYAVLALIIYQRPVFVATELFHGAVLVGSTGLGSHLLRTFYRHYLTRASLLRQVLSLLAGSLLIAASATGLLLLSFFLLTLTEFSFPVPPEQRWFVVKTIFTGNFFNMALAMLFWSSVYFSVSKVRQLRQTTELLHATQLDALVSQLNPHFLFNALNNIRALILEDPDKARHMLADLSDMLRYNLAAEDGVKVPLKQELSIVHNYLALCSIQFEHRLQYQERIAAGCEELAVPKLLLQLCVENAIKHGISHLPQGGTIHISASASATQLKLRIANHGRLNPEAATGTGVGLKNIRQRLLLLYQGKASLELYQQQDQVITKITLPREPMHERSDH